jgi:hypothetical protein
MPAMRRVLPFVLALAGCGGPGPQPPPVYSPTPTPAVAVPSTADPDVAAAVTAVIGSAHHPELKWPDIPEVAPTLRELYAAEPDGLFWFEGGRPHPSVPRS